MRYGTISFQKVVASQDPSRINQNTYTYSQAPLGAHLEAQEGAYSNSHSTFASSRPEDALYDNTGLSSPNAHQAALGGSQSSGRFTVVSSNAAHQSAMDSSAVFSDPNLQSKPSSSQPSKCEEVVSRIRFIVGVMLPLVSAFFVVSSLVSLGQNRKALAEERISDYGYSVGAAGVVTLLQGGVSGCQSMCDSIKKWGKTEGVLVNTLTGPFVVIYRGAQFLIDFSQSESSSEGIVDA